jgi:pyruvate dehydrogenase E2 component (dihydrolipoamide acetyltransferase)
MTTDIVFPEFAEDGDERAKVVAWLIPEGQKVAEDDEVVELLTDKATFTVPSPSTGILKYSVKEGQEIDVHTVLGTITSE